MLRCTYILNFMKIQLFFKHKKIYIKSTILKLEKTNNILEILFLYIVNMLNFKRLALIATEIQSDETKISGSILSPHQVHSFTRILKWPSFKILRLDSKINLHCTICG